MQYLPNRNQSTPTSPLIYFTAGLKRRHHSSASASINTRIAIPPSAAATAKSDYAPGRDAEVHAQPGWPSPAQQENEPPAATSDGTTQHAAQMALIISVL